MKKWLFLLLTLPACAQVQIGRNVKIGGGGSGGGVTSINGTPGDFTFTGPGVNCVTTTCTFSGSGSGIGSITWAIPSWLTASPTTISATGTQTFSPTTAQTSHKVIGTCGAATTFTPCSLVIADLPSIAFTNISGIATTAQIGTGTPAAGKYVDGAAGAWTTLPSGPTLQTNTVANTSQALLNFTTSTANSVGLTITPSNPSGGVEKFEVTGSSYTGNAATATALASTPTLCTTGQAPTGVLANGNATGCASISGGSPAWNSITNPTGNQSLSMVANTTLWTYGATTGSGDMVSITDTASNTGTGNLVHIHTAASSTEIPFQADANGCGFKLDATGAWVSVGSGCTDPSQMDLTYNTGHAPVPPSSTSVSWAPNTSGQYTVSETGAAYSRVCTAANGVCSGTTPVTTKGDLYTFSTVPARLPVGTDGFYLVADSTQTTGIKWAALTGGGNTTSTSLTSNIMPKANGANSIINSSVTDNGTTVTTSDTGGYTGPSFNLNGTTAGFMDFAQGSTSAAVAPCSTANSWCKQAPASLSSNFIETFQTPATGLTWMTLSGSAITDTTATSANLITLWTGTCSSSTFLRGDGACAAGGGGDTITSPNSTITVGGTSSATTLDVVGAAGKILAGATPALTFTPTLGTSGNAGTLSMFPASGNFTTTWGSGATASNTILGFPTAPISGDLVECITVTTTCTLTDTLLPLSSVAVASSALTANRVLIGGGGQNVSLLGSLGTTTTVLHGNAAGAPSFGAVVGADMTNNTVTATQLAAQYSKGSCMEVWGGSGTSFALTSGDDAISNNSCYNDSGVTRTITAVKCYSDNASNTTTVNPTFGASGTGTTILSGALTCGNSNAMSSTGTVSNASWTTGSGVNPAMAGTLTGTHIGMIVEYTF